MTFRARHLLGIEPLAPDEIVAMGAAVQGGVMSGALEEVVLLEVTPFSLGIETKDNTFTRIIEKTGALQYTADRAQEAADAAIAALGDIPDSDYKKALVAVAEFAVQRRS